MLLFFPLSSPLTFSSLSSTSLSFIQFFTVPFLLSIVTAVHYSYTQIYTQTSSICVYYYFLSLPSTFFCPQSNNISWAAYTHIWVNFSVEIHSRSDTHKWKQKHKHKPGTEAGAFCRGNHLVIAGYKSKLMHNSCTPWKEVNAQSQAWSQQDFYPSNE